ncbi:MAG: hypothetical protein LUH07_14555, partial [Lachnospiraceae bacterium]|nr:hypothetical protein [Lachnospiraceae bacterium]
MNRTTTNHMRNNSILMDERNQNEHAVSNCQQTYLRSLQKHRHRILFTRIWLFLLFLLIWEMAVRLHWIDGFIFSSPSRILKTFQSMLTDGSIFVHTGITMAETVISFALVCLLGTAISVMV